MSFSLVGLLFDLHYGFWTGAAFAFLIFLFISIWGEKLVLIFLRARYVTDDEILINQVKNFCSHHEIPEIKIYWTNVFVNNLYYTNTYWGKPTLIIGKNLYLSFTRNELNSLINASLMKLKTREAQQRTVGSLLFLFLYSPVYLLRSLVRNSSIHKVLNLFLYPAFYLKSVLNENEADIFEFDQKVGKLEGLKKDYAAALFKVSHLPVCREFGPGSLISTELCIVKNKSEDVLSLALVRSVDVDKRVKALR